MAVLTSDPDAFEPLYEGNCPVCYNCMSLKQKSVVHPMPNRVICSECNAVLAVAYGLRYAGEPVV